MIHILTSCILHFFRGYKKDNQNWLGRLEIFSLEEACLSSSCPLFVCTWFKWFARVSGVRSPAIREAIHNKTCYPKQAGTILSCWDNCSSIPPREPPLLESNTIFSVSISRDPNKTRANQKPICFVVSKQTPRDQLLLGEASLGKEEASRETTIYNRWIIAPREESMPLQSS